MILMVPNVTRLGGSVTHALTGASRSRLENHVVLVPESVELYVKERESAGA